MTSNPRKRRILYAATDGTYGYKSKIGCWCYVTEGDEPVTGLGTGRVTHNRMELMAFLKLLEAFPNEDIHVFCDSMAVVKGFTEKINEWARRNYKTKSGKLVAHRDLWKKISKLSKDRQITIEHVKSHSGHKMNTIADKAAGNTRRKHENERSRKIQETTSTNTT